MEKVLEQILANTYVIIGLLVLCLVPIMGLALYMLDVIRHGEVRHIPLLQQVSRMVKLAADVVKAVAPKRKRIKKEYSVPVTPDAPEEMVQKMAKWILAELNKGDAANVNLTDAYWVKGGGWKDLTGGTPSQFYAVMARLEDARIWQKKDTDKGNGKRVLCEPYRSLDSKLKKQLGN